jgi:hypothetical protein
VKAGEGRRPKSEGRRSELDWPAEIRNPKPENAFE